MSSNSKRVVVVGAVLDQRALILYLADGTQRSVKQGSPHLAGLLHQTLSLVEKRASMVEVDLPDNLDLAIPVVPVGAEKHESAPNGFSKYEEKSSGLVRFFRIAKSKVQSFFGRGEQQDRIPKVTVEANLPLPLPARKDGMLGYQPTPMTIPSFLDNGPIPLSTPSPQLPAPTGQPTTQATEKLDILPQLPPAIREIMANAVPASSTRFDASTEQEEEESTVVALIADPKKAEAVLVPGVEAIRPQIETAMASGDMSNMEAFFQRLGDIAKTRRHSAQELLNFLRKGDLPLASDGSIIIYKVLRRATQELCPEVLQAHPWASYVDCHSRKVPQRVGSLVTMVEELIDPSRHTQCSSGLHVARRGYIRSFPGDVCILGRVLPEDVIAVPFNEPDKMRVAKYQILYELPEEAFKALQKNESFRESSEAKRQLALALSGQFSEPTEVVLIGGNYGTKITVTHREKQAVGFAEPVTPETPKETPLPEAAPISDELLQSPPKVRVESPAKPKEDLSAPPVDPKQLAKTIEEKKTVQTSAQTALQTTPKTTTPPRPSIPVVEQESRAKKAQRLFRTMNEQRDPAMKAAGAQALLNHKKEVKLGWKALGLPENTPVLLSEILGTKTKPKPGKD